MTVQTTFTDRWMLPKERASLLSVTLVARLVDRVGFQKRIGQGTVRVVAVVAAHLPFRQWHV